MVCAYFWRDNWLPRGNLKITGKASNLRNRWVSDLINQNTKTWKEDVVRALFHPPDAEVVLQINLPNSDGEDMIAWHYERNGRFSVRSAYRLGMEIQSRDKQESTSSNPGGERGLWKLIWNANVPPKIKVFAWKLATDTLGVQIHRCRRKMDVIPTCQICGMEPETSHHAMVKCTKARALRERLRDHWDLPPDSKLSYTGNEWVLVLLNQCSEVMRANLLALWWRCWHLRNNSIFGDGTCGINQSATFLQSYLASYQQKDLLTSDVSNKGKKPLFKLGEGEPKLKKETKEHWRKPSEGWTKLNVDASFSADDNSGSWGAILRDNSGAVLLSAWGRIGKCSSAMIAEAVAVLEGTKAIITEAFLPVQVESDCASVVCELTAKDSTKSEISLIISDVKQLLMSLSDWRINKINRSANQAAHNLATYSRTSGSDGVLYGLVPISVEGSVHYDCNVLCTSVTCL